MAHPEVDPAVTRRLGALLLIALLLGGAFGALAASASAAPPTAPAAAPSGLHANSGQLTANITGPSILALRGVATYLIHATGGPAVAPNGTIIGNLTYFAQVLGSNLTGVSLSPTSSLILNNSPGMPNLDVANSTEVLTIAVEVTSVYQTQNVSINITYTVHVVQPYEVRATLVASGASTGQVTVLVQLDGVLVGNVSVPNLVANQTTQFEYSYVTLGLSPGTHTFTLMLENARGLIHFANGLTAYSVSFYVPGPGPNYQLWYLVGAVAFFGTTFILATRLAARRRGSGKR